MIAPGNAFLIPSDEGKKHLFFVVYGPAILPGYGKIPHCILAGATTIYEGSRYDPACIIDSGEHPFIRHRSYIAYRYAQIYPETDVAKRANTLWTQLENCDAALLERIASGIINSRYTPNHVRQALRHQRL
jgi:hypothetical protein